MKLTKKIKREVIITDDVICNKCGKSCKGEMGHFNGLIETTIEGAYDSTHLEDCTNYTFSLCEECLSKLFAKFKFPVLRGGLYERIRYF